MKDFSASSNPAAAIAKDAVYKDVVVVGEFFFQRKRAFIHYLVLEQVSENVV